MGALSRAWRRLQRLQLYEVRRALLTPLPYRNLLSVASQLDFFAGERCTKVTSNVL